MAGSLQSTQQALFIVIPTATPQIKILTLSLILMSCLTSGKSFNLSTDEKTEALCTYLQRPGAQSADVLAIRAFAIEER